MSVYGPPGLCATAGAPRPAPRMAGAFASVIDAFPRELPATGLAAERIPAQAPPRSWLRRVGRVQERQGRGLLPCPCLVGAPNAEGSHAPTAGGSKPAPA